MPTAFASHVPPATLAKAETLLRPRRQLTRLPSPAATPGARAHHPAEVRGCPFFIFRTTSKLQRAQHPPVVAATAPSWPRTGRRLHSQKWALHNRLTPPASANPQRHNCDENRHSERRGQVRGREIANGKNQRPRARSWVHKLIWQNHRCARCRDVIIPSNAQPLEYQNGRSRTRRTASHPDATPAQCPTGVRRRECLLQRPPDRPGGRADCTATQH